MPFGGLLTAGLLAGGSALAGALGGKPKTTTSTPTYTPNQTQLQGDVFGNLDQQLKNPTDYLTPQKNAVIGNINNTYNNEEKSTEAALTRNGFGGSGKTGTNLQQIQLGRAGADAGVESQFAGLAQQQQNTSLSQALQFAFAGPGNTTTGPNTSLSGAVGGGLQTATLLYALNNFMGGGSGGSLTPGGSGIGGYDNTPATASSAGVGAGSAAGINVDPYNVQGGQ